MCKAVSQQTAILFFSRSPREEVDAKQLAFRRSRAAVRLLLAHGLRQARKTGLPLYTCYTAQQRGANFGERLANALEDVYAAGHERVIIIGNDSPGLRVRHILAAETQLLNDQLVLGPAADGGNYLIGIHRAAYHRRHFLQLAWETADLQASWRGYTQTFDLQTTALPKLVDLDTITDFWRYLRQLPSSLLARRLRVCLVEIFHEITSPKRAVSYRLLRLVTPCLQRGPPCLI